MPGEIMSAIGRTMPYTYLLSLRELLHLSMGSLFLYLFLNDGKGCFWSNCIILAPAN